MGRTDTHESTKIISRYRERIELEFSPEYMFLARKALTQVNQNRIEKGQQPIDIKTWFKWLVTTSLAQTIAATETG